MRYPNWPYVMASVGRKEVVMKRSLICGIILAFFAQAAWADCEYQGKYYKTGTRVGSKVCQADGTWK
jgi:hypothetical protein